MDHSELDGTWAAAFPDKQRPEIYAGNDFNEDGFRPLTDAQEFLMDLTKLTTTQLYVLGDNNQEAMQLAQAEYMELDRLINHLKSRDPTAAISTKHPQALPTTTEFEERKESILYGYKYDPNRPLASYGRWQDASEQERRDLRSDQDPFTQGGFVPNDRQYRGSLNRAKDKRNPDGWAPVLRDRQRLIPKMAARVNEKEEYWQLSGLLPLGKGLVSKPVTRSGTPDMDLLGVGGRDTPVNKRLRNTRFNGAKVPLTRDVSEAPSLPASRASTPKRKRGDTPIVYNDQNGSPVKKPRIIVTEGDIQFPPKRKHHNQYTKAKEKAALEALAAQKAEAENKMSIAAAIADQDIQIASVEPSNYSWTGLTDQEKRDFHWNNDTLLLAVREDASWLNEDMKTRQKWTKKILESKYPVRTYSMYKKWDYWRSMGEDKRPRNKKKSKNPDLDDDEQDMDEASEIATPSPLSRNYTMHDYEDEEELGRPVSIISPGPSRLGLGEVLMQDLKGSEDGLSNGNDYRNGSGSRRASASDSASQTISVSQEDSLVNAAYSNSRRATRASRMVSS